MAKLNKNRSGRSKREKTKKEKKKKKKKVKKKREVIYNKNIKAYNRKYIRRKRVIY